MTNLVPCPHCGQLHENLGDEVPILVCPFQSPGTIGVFSNTNSPRGVATIDLGEPVGEKVETAAERARRMLYGVAA